MATWFPIAIVSLSAVALVSCFDDSCPYQKCACQGDYINCEFKEFKKLPPLHSVNNTKLYTLDFNGNSLTSIPARGLPPRILSLDFQENPITTIDQDAFNDSAETLTQLQFAEALFTDLPRALLRLNAFTDLTVSNTRIQTWDEEVIKHIGATLTSLNLSNVSLTSWPTWVQYLPHLVTLELSGASFTIPDNAFDNQIKTLSNLNLANGVLSEIPSALSKLTSLRSLILENNNISRLTGFPASPVFSELIIDNNKLTNTEGLINAFKSVAGSLQVLRVSTNLLTNLPDLSSMTVLETVYFSNNSISYIGTARIPPSLQYLGLENNNIQTLSSFLQSGFNLTVLDLQYNAITSLNQGEIPANVEYLDVSRNYITELTDESFPQNSSMTTLTLDSNPISKVSPNAFARLTKLSFLSMIYTKITRLPLSLAHLTKAISIDLTGNYNLVCTCEEKDLRSLADHQVRLNGQCGVTTVDNFINVMTSLCPD